jgi:hypothetical protein
MLALRAQAVQAVAETGQTVVRVQQVLQTLAVVAVVAGSTWVLVAQAVQVLLSCATLVHLPLLGQLQVHRQSLFLAALGSTPSPAPAQSRSDHGDFPKHHIGIRHLEPDGSVPRWGGR